MNTGNGWETLQVINREDQWALNQTVDNQTVVSWIDGRYTTVETFKVKTLGVMIPFKLCSGVIVMEAMESGVNHSNVRR